VLGSSDSEARGWGKHSEGEDGLYTSRERLRHLADASRGRLCTHEVRVSPPTNEHTVAHNR
jgi:hypothetical protein